MLAKAGTVPGFSVFVVGRTLLSNADRDRAMLGLRRFGPCRGSPVLVLRGAPRVDCFGPLVHSDKQVG
jgi:hypothetical protein